MNMGLIFYSAHYAARIKMFSLTTEGFVVISQSKLDPYQDNLLYVRVINSSYNGFSSWITAKYEALVV